MSYTPKSGGNNAVGNVISSGASTASAPPSGLAQQSSGPPNKTHAQQPIQTQTTVSSMFNNIAPAVMMQQLQNQQMLYLMQYQQQNPPSNPTNAASALQQLQQQANDAAAAAAAAAAAQAPQPSTAQLINLIQHMQQHQQQQQHHHHQQQHNSLIGPPQSTIANSASTTSSAPAPNFAFLNSVCNPPAARNKPLPPSIIATASQSPSSLSSSSASPPTLTTLQPAASILTALNATSTPPPPLTPLSSSSPGPLTLVSSTAASSPIHLSTLMQTKPSNNPIPPLDKNKAKIALDLLMQSQQSPNALKTSDSLITPLHSQHSLISPVVQSIARSAPATRVPTSLPPVVALPMQSTVAATAGNHTVGSGQAHRPSASHVPLPVTSPAKLTELLPSAKPLPVTGSAVAPIIATPKSNNTSGSSNSSSMAISPGSPASTAASSSGSASALSSPATPTTSKTTGTPGQNPNVKQKTGSPRTKQTPRKNTNPLRTNSALAESASQPVNVIATPPKVPVPVAVPVAVPEQSQSAKPVTGKSEPIAKKPAAKDVSANTPKVVAAAKSGSDSAPATVSGGSSKTTEPEQLVNSCADRPATAITEPAPAKQPGTSRAISSSNIETSNQLSSQAKRHRAQTVLYQSPTPELTLVTKLSVSEAKAADARNRLSTALKATEAAPAVIAAPKSAAATPRASTAGSNGNKDQLVLFYKGEFLAVRNAESGFFLCQTLHNVYKSSPRIRIRWMSEKEGSENLYVKDFYDSTDLECVLTSLTNLDRVEKTVWKLTRKERERIESILKKAIDVERGLLPMPKVTEENPDGLDLSLYTNESQIEKKPKTGAALASKRKADAIDKKGTDIEITTPVVSRKVTKNTTVQKKSGRHLATSKESPQIKSTARSRKRTKKGNPEADDEDEDDYDDDTDEDYSPVGKRRSTGRSGPGSLHQGSKAVPAQVSPIIVEAKIPTHDDKVAGTAIPLRKEPAGRNKIDNNNASPSSSPVSSRTYRSTPRRTVAIVRSVIAAMDNEERASESNGNVTKDTNKSDALSVSTKNAGRQKKNQSRKNSDDEPLVKNMDCNPEPSDPVAISVSSEKIESNVNELPMEAKSNATPSAARITRRRN